MAGTRRVSKDPWIRSTFMSDHKNIHWNNTFSDVSKSISFCPGLTKIHKQGQTTQTGTNKHKQGQTNTNMDKPTQTWTERTQTRTNKCNF